MDLHHFDGKNLSVWMFQLQQNFLYYNTPNDLHKYMMASYYMEGEALDWLVTMERDGVFTMDADWEKFVRLIHLRFGQESEDQQFQQLGDFMANCEQVQKRDEEPTDSVEVSYHLFNEISQPKSSESLVEKQFPDSVPKEVENQEEFTNEEEEKRDSKAKSTFISVTDLATEPADDPKHSINTAADPVDNAYHLFNVIPPPQISETPEEQLFIERSVMDYQVPYRYAEHLFDANYVDSGNGKHNPRRAEILEWVAPQQHGGYAVPRANILEASIHMFDDLAEMVSGISRPAHDRFYCTIGMYLEEHPGISKSERKRICKLMDYKQLTVDACRLAVQNERLSLRVVV